MQKKLWRVRVRLVKQSGISYSPLHHTTQNPDKYDTFGNPLNLDIAKCLMQKD